MSKLFELARTAMHAQCSPRMWQLEKSCAEGRCTVRMWHGGKAGTK